MFRPSFMLIAILAILAGATHAETDWSVLKAPDSDLNTTVVVYTVLAIIVTIVQFLHCLAAVWKKEAGLGQRTFDVLLPGLASLLALYILRAYFLTHHNHHISRAIYAMLYFTEQFSSILIAASTMVLLYCAERDWYQNTTILRVRKGLALLFVVAWLALVVAQTIIYRQSSDIDHNAVFTLTIALYRNRLTDAIIGFYNLVTLDIALSSFVLWIHARIRADPEAGPDRRIKFLLFITPLLALRSLALLIVHVLSLTTIPRHLVSTVGNVIYIGWFIVDPTLCYVALYALLRVSQASPPLRFRTIVQGCLGCFIVVFGLLDCLCPREWTLTDVEQDIEYIGPPE
ncbi:hypothetical protein C8J57DRAFT_1623696 [Mycena rebaudengoi]|nr:hypothetical protein C8J57DRAFT_1623696 [Mycena rebaudengoi]